MRHARVETIVQSVAFEFDILGHRVQERIFRQVVTVQFPGQVRIVHVVDLRYACQRGFSGRGYVQLDRYRFPILVHVDCFIRFLRV